MLDFTKQVEQLLASYLPTPPQFATMQATCLADLFNLQLWMPDRAPNYADVRDGITDLVAAALTALAGRGLRTTELLVRLYGGWHRERLDDPSPLRDLTAAVLRNFHHSGRPRLRLQLADSPIWDPSIRLLRTLRDLPLRAPTRNVTIPTSCPHAGACTIGDLTSWLKNRCPDSACTVRLSDLATVSRQKMVDTLLTADALTIARDGLAEAILIASDDADMVPALLNLTNAEIRVIRLRRAATVDSYYDGILELSGLSTHSW